MKNIATPFLFYRDCAFHHVQEVQPGQVSYTPIRFHGGYNFVAGQSGRPVSGQKQPSSLQTKQSGADNPIGRKVPPPG
jgi:hypothetical protein